MPPLRHKQTGEVFDIPDSAVLDAISTGLYEAPGADVQIPVNLDGLVGQVSGDDLGYAAGIGATPETEEQFRAREQAARIEREHGGALGTAATFVEQGLDTATLGAFGAATDVIWGDDYTEDRQERLEANPVAGGVGTVAGAVAPALLSGGAGTAGSLARLTPGGAASALGARIASRGGVSAMAAGAATEGALFGAGHVLSEAVLHDKELSAEAFLAGAAQGGLWGGVAGAGFGLLSKGVQAGKRAVDKAASGRAVESSLASLEKEAKVAAREAERASRLKEKLQIEQMRAENRSALEAQKTGGKLEVIGARSKAELAKAEAQAIAAKARVEKVSEAIEVERAKFERAKMVMDKRLELADVYKSGWGRAADSREAVAASKLEAAEIGADAKMRAGFSDALARSERKDAGYLIEELIPAKLRTPQAAEAAKGAVLNQAAQHAAATDDLVRQADEMMAINPQLAPEIQAARDRAAEMSPRLTEWSQKQANSRAFQEAHLEELKAAGFSADGSAVAQPAPLPTPAVGDDFAEGLDTLKSAEQAHYDLAQAIRPYLDEVSGMSLDDALRGMDDALAKQDEIVEDVILRRAEAAVDDGPALPPPEPLPGEPPLPTMPPMPAIAQPVRGGAASQALGVMDLAAAAGGLPNFNDIPVIGPLVGTYLKFRAVSGALRRVGLRVGGPVAGLAKTSAQVQDATHEAVRALVSGAEKGARATAAAAPSLSSVLSQPLWEPLEENERPPAPAPVQYRGQKPGRATPQQMFEERQEEILRATADPEAAKQQVAESIPAPPPVARAVAETWFRGIEWLAGQMPADPRPPGLQASSYPVPMPELQRFAEAVQAVRDPVSVFRRMAMGAISPISAQAVRDVYPRLFQEAQAELIEQVSQSRKPIPPARKSLLSLVFEIPIDGTTSPEYTAARQEEYAMAAQAQPQPTGPKLSLSSQHELGPTRRAMR